MKSFKFLFPLAFMAFVVSSCQKDETTTTIVDFEDVTLTSGISASTSFTSGNCKFSGNPVEFLEWRRSLFIKKRYGYHRIFESVQHHSRIGSSEIKTIWNSVCSWIFYLSGRQEGSYSIESIMVTNSTYAYFDMKNGNAPYSKKFVAGDWFKLTIKGYYSNAETAAVDVYLKPTSEIIKAFRDERLAKSKLVGNG